MTNENIAALLRNWSGQLAVLALVRKRKIWYASQSQESNIPCLLNSNLEGAIVSGRDERLSEVGRCAPLFSSLRFRSSFITLYISISQQEIYLCFKGQLKLLYIRVLITQLVHSTRHSQSQPQRPPTSELQSNANARLKLPLQNDSGSVPESSGFPDTSICFILVLSKLSSVAKVPLKSLLSNSK